MFGKNLLYSYWYLLKNKRLKLTLVLVSVHYNIVKLVEKMPGVKKAVIKANVSYF